MNKRQETIALLILLFSMIFCVVIDDTQASVVIEEQLDHKDASELTSQVISTEDTDIADTDLEDKNSGNNDTESIDTEDKNTEDIYIENSTKEEISIENISSEIYSFFQTYEAWWQGVTWSGEWGTRVYEGKSFRDFGCGLCCIANVYDTLSPYEISPWDAFEYAKQVSGYAPSSSGAAISWSDMHTTLISCGIICELNYKSSSYEEFKQQISQCTSAIVLVSSVNDNSYWTTTKGHYVSIWNYDKDSDTVFLADSGKISHNRQRIPLSYVYNALKTASDYQYLTVSAYVEDNNSWKGDGITEQWIRP